MKIYTRTGDRGTTALFGAGRVSKADPRVAAYGTVDELNSVLGWALTAVEVGDTGRRLERIQHDLFALGSALASPGADPKSRPLPTARVEEMEAWIDEADGTLPELRAFILPGGAPGAAALHVARTVCRRAERAVVALAGTEDGSGDRRATGEAAGAGDEDADRVTVEAAQDPSADAVSAVDHAVLRYLNRLSDLLFVLARLENHETGRGDVVWEREEG